MLKCLFGISNSGWKETKHAASQYWVRIKCIAAENACTVQVNECTGEIFWCAHIISKKINSAKIYCKTLMHNRFA